MQSNKPMIMMSQKIKSPIYAVLLLSVFLYSSCANKRASEANRLGSIPELLDRKGWDTDTLREDVIWYKYSSATDKEFANQKVNIVSFNPQKNKGNAILEYRKGKDSLSAFAATLPGVIAGINATYFLEKKDSADYMFLRLKGKDLQTVKVPRTSIYFWKHAGMFTFNNQGTNFKISYSPADFNKVKEENVVTGAPVLIDNFKPVGLTFADTTGVNIKKLHYEHYLKHQGVRHPRTAIAVTGSGSLLLITVDGRNKQALGMSAKELTAFLTRYFNPKSAMNIDGGGSTMMWVKGQPFNGIVNYPTDNKKFDHYGQRQVETVLFIK